MPEPQQDPDLAGDQSEDEAPHSPVAGTVRLMTEEHYPLDVDSAGLLQRVAAIVNRRPWIVPAALMGLGVAVLALRRRR